MPLDWTISHDERLVTLKSEGALRYDEIERYLACVSAEGAMPYRKLFDARGGRSELNEQQMMSYAGSMSGYSQRDPLGPYAVVVGADRGRAHEPLLRLLILTRKQRPIRMFLDADEARDWLCKQPAPWEANWLGGLCQHGQAPAS